MNIFLKNLFEKIFKFFYLEKIFFVSKKMPENYDYDFIFTVLSVITNVLNDGGKNYTEETKEWYEELKDMCQHYLLNLEKRNDLEYDDPTVEGEIIADYIYQNSGDVVFQNATTTKLKKLMNERNKILPPFPLHF
jgi:hypothetical protein